MENSVAYERLALMQSSSHESERAPHSDTQMTDSDECQHEGEGDSTDGKLCSMKQLIEMLRICQRKELQKTKKS